MEEKIIKLKLSTAREIYKTASKEFRKVLEENFGIVPLSEDICDRVQTMEDVYSICGVVNSHIPFPNEDNADSIIKKITKAYNQEVKIDFNDKTQRKYYLYFEKTHAGWVLVGVCDDCYFAGLGSGHYFTSEKNARDAYSKFKDVWDEYLPK